MTTVCVHKTKLAKQKKMLSLLKWLTASLKWNKSRVQ